MSDRPSSSRLVVHLLPVDVARGAQAYAQAVSGLLSSDGWQHRVVALFETDPATEARTSESARFDSLERPYRRRRRRGLDLGTIAALRRRLRDLAPDIVVAHGSEPFLYASLATPRGAALAYYRIGVSGPKLSNPLRRGVYRLAARRVDLVLGVSEETLVDARTVLAVPEARLRLVPNGRDPEPFDVALDRSGPAARGATDPVRLLWVSHLTRHKRPDWFVEAVRRLTAAGIAVDARLVGDGPMLGQLERAGLPAGLDLLGRRDDIPALMVDSDVFCFSSQGENEGMPGVLIEAGLAALPTVATRVPGTTTVIDHGVTGHVVDVDDLDGFVDAIGRLVADPGERRVMGERARVRCRDRFTLVASARRFHEVLEELVR